MQTHFTRDELLAWEQSQKGGGHVTSGDQPNHVTYSPPAVKAHIRLRIYDAVYSAAKGQQPRRLKRSEIATLLGLKQTPWLRQHIEALVASGQLVRIAGTAPNGALQYEYGLR